MKSVDIVDRSSLMKGLYRELSLRAEETAIVTIDMHRGHLDMEVATMPAKPEDAKRVIESAREALDFARKARIPVIHVVLVYRRLSLGMRRRPGPARTYSSIRDAISSSMPAK